MAGRVGGASRSLGFWPLIARQVSAGACAQQSHGKMKMIGGLQSAKIRKVGTENLSIAVTKYCNNCLE